MGWEGLARLSFLGIVIFSILVLVIVLIIFGAFDSKFGAFDSKHSNNSLPYNSSFENQNKSRPIPNFGQIRDLHSLVEINDYQKVRLLLKNGVDADSGQDKNNAEKQNCNKECAEFTPLYYAIENGNYKMAKLLLHYGADPNRHYLYVLSPMYSAIHLRRHDIMQLLIDFGADVNAHGGSSDEPYLIQAIHNCDIKAAEILLRNAANPKVENASGSSALHLSKSRAQSYKLTEAEREQYAEIARLLETYLKNQQPQGE